MWWWFTTINSRNLNPTHQIPLDVIQEILSWLPAKSAIRFKCVCKEWCNLINSPLFVKLHLNKSLQSDSTHNHPLLSITTLSIVNDFNRPSRWTKLNKDILGIFNITFYTTVVGSCNGLVCIKIAKDRSGADITVKCFLICNPTTGTFKVILPSSDNKWSSYLLGCGFGYDNEHDDYKIVVTSNYWTESNRDVCIYSVNADLWRCPNSTSPTRVSFGRFERWKTRNDNVIIFKDEMLHYLISADGTDNEVNKDYRIARFDIVTEKWRDDLSLPKFKNLVQFGELDGRLYLRVGSRYSQEVWTMEKTEHAYEVEEDGSWNKMFEIPEKLCDHALIGRSKDGRNRLLFRDLWSFKWYDDKDRKTVPFALIIPSLISTLIFCMPSLVSIPGCSLENLHEYKEEKKAKCRLLTCLDDILTDLYEMIAAIIYNLFS